MRSYSAFIVTFVMFSGLISGLPNMNRLDIRSDSISQSNRGLLSARSNMTPLPRYRRRAIFGERQPKPGVKCDGTFYKQARIEAVATKACKDAYAFEGRIKTKNPLSKMFRGPRPVYPGPKSLFPNEIDPKLTMVRITRGFFSYRRIGAFLRLSKKDYIVFANACRSVGIVRQISKTDFVLCGDLNGGSAAFNAPLNPSR